MPRKDPIQEYRDGEHPYQSLLTALDPTGDAAKTTEGTCWRCHKPFTDANVHTAAGWTRDENIRHLRKLL